MKIYRDLIKDLFDRLLALAGLIVASPVMLVIAVLIKIKMPDGPVIFKQQRVGKNGKLFTMYKFRSMKHKSSGTTVTVSGDSRITPLGAFLRKYKLDELPELWNILKGDMSFVGPRPDVPEYMNRLKGEERKILELKPGLTGPASIKYVNEEELLSKAENPVEYYDNMIFPDKIKINLDYYYNMNLFKDLKYLVQTVFRIK